MEVVEALAVLVAVVQEPNNLLVVPQVQEMKADILQLKVMLVVTVQVQHIFTQVEVEVELVV
jgi:hypothetical protein